MSPPPPQHTPLHDLHRELGGKLVDFAGWLLPLSYAGGGLIAEHAHTRTAASLFDVSHMGQLTLRRSAAAAQALAALMPANPAAIPENGAKYTLLTTPTGGVIDDCIVTSDGADGWYIVVNASRKAIDIPHLRAALEQAQCADPLIEHSDSALLAIQGPAAADITAALFPAAAALRFMQSIRQTHPEFGPCRLSRCGYTGEDGFELSVPAAGAAALARRLLSHSNCKPAGLGARDSLRIEAGLCLYGNELNENTTPIEAGLKWTIPKSRRGSDGNYLGAAAIADQINGGAPRRLAALLPQSKTPVRAGAALLRGGVPAGAVTSGVYSPTLKTPIALAYLDAQTPEDAELTAVVRGQEIACRQTALPFVPHRYRRA